VCLVQLLEGPLQLGGLGVHPGVNVRNRRPDLKTTLCFGTWKAQSKLSYVLAKDVQECFST
jgi:hypothetical protein